MRVPTSFLCSFLLVCACGKQEERQGDPPPIAAPAPCAPGLEQSAQSPIAIINGTAIPCADLYARDRAVIDAITAKYNEKLMQIHAVTLKQLIDDRLLQAAADEAKLSVEKFVASSISAVPATEEDVKNFYDQAIASGEKLPALEETKDDIAAFITEERQKSALSAFRAALRKKAQIESLLPSAKSATPTPPAPPAAASPGTASPAAAPPGTAPRSGAPPAVPAAPPAVPAAPPAVPATTP